MKDISQFLVRCGIENLDRLDILDHGFEAKINHVIERLDVVPHHLVQRRKIRSGCPMRRHRVGAHCVCVCKTLRKTPFSEVGLGFI